MVLKDMTNIIVSALLLAVIFGKSFVLPGISIGDIFFILAFIVAGINVAPSRSALKLPKYTLYILLIILWSLINFLLANIINIVDMPDYFWGSFFRLIFYGFGSIIILMFLRRAPMQSLMNPARMILMFSTWIALFVLIIQYINDFGLELPVWLFWYGQGGVAVFGDVVGVLETSDFKIYKLRGIFMEPSLYGIYTILVLAIFHRYGINKRLTYIQKYAIYASLFLTFSLTSYFLFLIYYFCTKKFNFKFGWSSFFTLISCVLAVSIFFQVFNEFVIERIFGVFAGDDRSASLRFLASIDTMFAAITNNLFLGSSLGYLEHLPGTLNLSFSYQTDINEFVTSKGNTQVILFNIFGSLGLVGLIIFVLMLFPIAKNCFQYFLVFFASTFAHGGTLEAIFWVFYLLGILMAREVYLNSVLKKSNRESVRTINTNKVLTG